MRCHYTYHEGEKVFIPGCIKAAAMGYDNIKECTCQSNTWASFERKEFNKQIEAMKQEIEERDVLIEELNNEIKRLKPSPVDADTSGTRVRIPDGG